MFLFAPIPISSLLLWNVKAHEKLLPCRLQEVGDTQKRMLLDVGLLKQEFF